MTSPALETTPLRSLSEYRAVLIASKETLAFRLEYAIAADNGHAAHWYQQELAAVERRLRMVDEARVKVMPDHVTEAFAEIAALAARLNIRDIGHMPGCWEQQIDEHWWIAVNGHCAETKCSFGEAVPPFSAYVRFNGWPAGIISQFDGCLAAGAAANEDAFIAALKACPAT